MYKRCTPILILLITMCALAVPNLNPLNYNMYQSCSVGAMYFYLTSTPKENLKENK